MYINQGYKYNLGTSGMESRGVREACSGIKDEIKTFVMYSEHTLGS